MIVTQVLEKLGEGTFSKVFNARIKSNGKKVAVKIVRSEIDTRSVYGENFNYEETFLDVIMTEVQLAIMVGLHPNIVQVLGIDEAFSSIVMERGQQDLQTFMDKATSKKFISIDWTRQLLSATAYIHSRSIVHQDLKPANVILFPDKRMPGFTLKLCDFGLSRRLESNMCTHGEIGTLWY